jgi:hypothetical protein
VDDGHKYYGNSGVSNYLYHCCYEKDRVLKSMKDNLSLSDSALSDLSSRYKQIREGIEKNYDTVILNVKALPNAKKAIEYLTELGFNLDEITKQDTVEITAIAVPVDTKFLFI